jgi:hypothetical protein
MEEKLPLWVVFRQRGGATGCFLSIDRKNTFFSKERKQWKKEKALEPILVS